MQVFRILDNFLGAQQDWICRDADFFFLGFWGGIAAIHSESLIKRNMEASLGSFISIPLFNQSVESSWTE